MKVKTKESSSNEGRFLCQIIDHDSLFQVFTLGKSVGEPGDDFEDAV